MKNSTIKCVIVDDIQDALDAVKNQCARHEEIEIIGEFTDSDLFLSEVENLDFDVCFLDIDMPNIRGTEVAKKLWDKKIIFITGEKQEAADAFNLDAVDFIVKPLFRSRFDEAIKKLKEKMKQEDLSNFYEKNKALEQDYVFLNTDKGKVKFKLSHIRYIGPVEAGSDSRDKTIILEDMHSYTLKNISKKKLMQEVLPDSQWIEVNKTELIHVNAVYGLPSVDEVELNIMNSKNKRICCTIGDTFRKDFDRKIQVFIKR